MTVEQARQFLEAARGYRLEGLFTMAILTGMREGELIALHWSDINFGLHYLQVRRTIVRLPGRGLVESEPKTSSSNRKIVLSELLLDVLRQQRVRSPPTPCHGAGTSADGTCFHGGARTV